MTLYPLVPAKAGIQDFTCWIPAFAGMGGAKCDGIRYAFGSTSNRTIQFSNPDFTAG